MIRLSTAMLAPLVLGLASCEQPAHLQVEQHIHGAYIDGPAGLVGVPIAYHVIATTKTGEPIDDIDVEVDVGPVRMWAGEHEVQLRFPPEPGLNITPGKEQRTANWKPARGMHEERVHLISKLSGPLANTACGVTFPLIVETSWRIIPRPGGPKVATPLDGVARSSDGSVVVRCPDPSKIR